MIDIRDLPLRHINSATKYPSILTYHELGERGKLRDEVQVPFYDDDKYIVTEKIDGTNARIVFFESREYLIGSREELLYARGDLVSNPALGIVEALKPTAESLADYIESPGVLVVYGEVFGGKVSNGSKNYTGQSKVGFRVFDVVEFVEQEFVDIVRRPLERVARWRDHGGQSFCDDYLLQEFISEAPEIVSVPVIEHDACIPVHLADAHRWMMDLLPDRKTGAALDDGARGRAEGVVIRSADRGKIAKLRFDDYQRTLKDQK